VGEGGRVAVDPRNQTVGRLGRACSALQATKTRGTKLGNPRLAEAAKRGVEALKASADQFAANVLPAIREIRETGPTSANAVAGKLNERG
jgi:hypothetical protein